MIAHCAGMVRMGRLLLPLWAVGDSSPIRSGYWALRIVSDGCHWWLIEKI